jgi:hypothetical protein
MISTIPWTIHTMWMILTKARPPTTNNPPNADPNLAAPPVLGGTVYVEEGYGAVPLVVSPPP